jgi:hypothetical protein
MSNVETNQVTAQGPGRFDGLPDRTARNTNPSRAFSICILERKMDRRDEVLLDKQMRRLIPPRHDGVLALIVTGMFIAGLSSGIALARKTPVEQIASNNAVIALANADNAIPVVRR